MGDETSPRNSFHRFGRTDQTRKPRRYRGMKKLRWCIADPGKHLHSGKGSRWRAAPSPALSTRHHNYPELRFRHVAGCHNY
jgi:hypothetical protein